MKWLIWMGFGMLQHMYFTRLPSSLFHNEGIQHLFYWAISTNHKSSKLSSYENAVLTSVLAEVIKSGLLCDGSEMRCPQDLVCRDILFSQAGRFLVLL